CQLSVRRTSMPRTGSPSKMNLCSSLMTTPRPTCTSVDPPRGCGPAWERPGARPAMMTTPRPTRTSVDPPRGCGPAWERPGALPAQSCQFPQSILVAPRVLDVVLRAALQPLDLLGRERPDHLRRRADDQRAVREFLAFGHQ